MLDFLPKLIDNNNRVRIFVRINPSESFQIRSPRDTKTGRIVGNTLVSEKHSAY
jgi:hypothetical protein